MARRFILFLTLVCCSLLGCEERLSADLSNEPEYKSFIGSRYEVTADLVAYAIKRTLNRKAEYMTLIPPPGIAGPEVEFTIPVNRGSEVTILRVVKTNRWPDPDLTLIVRLADTRIPPQLPVRIDLFGGNERAGGVLMNPAIYRKSAR
jgi:hypothetical protein